MPVREQAPQSPPYEPSGNRRKRRLVIDVIDEHCAVGMRLDDVAVVPVLERAAHLLIFEKKRRIVDGMHRFDAHRDAGRDADRCNRAAPRTQIGRALEHLGVLPRRHQSIDRIGQLVKREQPLGGGANDAARDEPHALFVP